MLPHQVFCHVDDGLLDLIRSYAHGRIIVDVGCGVGMLGAKMKGIGIISIDIHERENPLIDNILIMDALDFPFKEDHFPVFLRPCHGHFVSSVLIDIEGNDRVWDALYVSKPENVKVDIPPFLGYDVREIDGWTGSEGERAYLVVIKGEYRMKKKNKREFWKIANLYDGQTEASRDQITWWEYDKSTGRLKNVMGGGFKPTDRTVVFDKVFAECTEDLDWTGTCYDNPNMKDGWLEPSGRYWGFDSMSHEYVAQVVFGFWSADEALDAGYIRIYSYSLIDKKPFCVMGDNVKPTEEQIKFLKERGISSRYDMGLGNNVNL